MKTILFFMLFLYVYSASGAPSTKTIEENTVIHLLDIAKIHFQKGEDPEAITCIEEAISLAKEIGMNEQQKKFGKAYSVLGYCYQYLENYPKAIQAHQKSIKILEQIDSSLSSTPHFNIAHLYSFQARYQKALKHYHKSLNYHLQKATLNNLDSSKISQRYLSIGQMHLSLLATSKDTTHIDTVLFFYNQALQFAEVTNQVAVGKTSFHLFKASLYREKGNQKGMEFSLRESEKYFKTALGYIGEENLLMLKGRIQNFKKDHKVALQTLQKALQEQKSNRKKAKIHTYISNIYFQLGKLDSSLQHSQKALQLLIPSFKQDNPEINPNLAAIAEKDIWIMQTLIYKGNAFKKRAKKDDLDHALNCYHLVFDAVEILMKDSEDKSEQSLRSHINTVIENIVEIYAQKGDANSFQNAFAAVERNKAITLLKKTTATDTIAVKNVQQIQSQLLSNSDENKALLEYFVGDSTVYAFLITPNKIQLKSIPNTTELNQNIASLYTRLQYDENIPAREQFNDYSKIGQKLYQQLLIEPFDTAILNQIQELYIIPDDYLYQIPFEALLTKTPTKKQINGMSYGTLNYLLKKHPISYAYSATLLLESFQKRIHAPQYKGTLLGFAPSFNGGKSKMRNCEGSELQDLNGSEAEVEIISKIIDGQIFLKKDANKEAFLDEARHYRILHLSTHACADEANYEANRIFFADSYLLNKELSMLRLQADLAVLSACLTGRGIVKRGEGIMSLARAFLYAGCPSVLSSLWSVDDEKTSELMGDFYRNLKEGQSKSAALQNAKIDFIKKQKDVHAHPFYWAAFVQIGNPNPIVLGGGIWNYWRVFVLALGMFVMVYLYVRKTN